MDNKKNDKVEIRSDKKLLVRNINYEDYIDIEKAEQLLDAYAEYELIDTVNWKDFPYNPTVKFKIAYSQNQLLLKFCINEETIRAKETQINGDVYKDSCVEFFISPDRNSYYYNFEFNCIGVIYAAHGQPGKDRTLLNPEIIKLIKVKSSLGNKSFEERKGGHQWDIVIVIPKECFVFDSSLVFGGLNSAANFYKCGDETHIPHFISWNPIKTISPDFHQPIFFGELQFEL